MAKEMTSSESEISNEKSNESQIDLINRSDAINAFWELNISLRPSAIDAIINMLRTVPSANLQPTCNQLATDCISRRAAIDAMKSISDSICEQQAIDALCELPSAQPDLSGYSDRLWKAAYERGKAEAQADIIHCVECKYYHDSDGCFFSTATTGADGFCHWAAKME